MSGVRKTSGTGAAQGVVREFPGARTNAAATAAVDRADSTGVSERARELAAALGAVQETEEVRARRVAELKARIADGSYNPDPREIARKLVERGFQ